MTLFIYLPIQQTVRKSILLLASVVNNNNKKQQQQQKKQNKTADHPWNIQCMSCYLTLTNSLLGLQKVLLDTGFYITINSLNR